MALYFECRIVDTISKQKFLDLTEIFYGWFWGERWSLSRQQIIKNEAFDDKGINFEIVSYHV